MACGNVKSMGQTFVLNLPRHQKPLAKLFFAKEPSPTLRAGESLCGKKGLPLSEAAVDPWNWVPFQWWRWSASAARKRMLNPKTLFLSLKKGIKPGISIGAVVFSLESGSSSSSDLKSLAKGRSAKPARFRPPSD